MEDEMLIVGTAYFVSKSKAARYYRDYEGDDGYAAVNRKLDTGEIHIGKPPMKTGDTLIVLDGGTRYGIIEANNTER